MLSQIVRLNINYGEADLVRKVKSMRDKWNKQQKVCELAYGLAQAFGLAKRIVD